MANLITSVTWPNEDTVIIYEKTSFVLLEGKGEYCAGIAIKLLNQDYKEGKTKVMIFLNALTWSKRAGSRITRWTNSSTMGELNDHLRLKKDTHGYTLCTHINFKINYLPSPKDRESRLTLALYREGMYLEHTGYSFLSFYKIINLKYKWAH